MKTFNMEKHVYMTFIVFCIAFAVLTVCRLFDGHTFTISDPATSFVQSFMFAIVYFAGRIIYQIEKKGL